MPVGIAGELGVQQKARRWMNYTDQHGRAWGANIEIRTGHPVGSIQPKFKAPWYPDDFYVQILPEVDGKPWAVEVNYEGAISFLVRRKEEYDREVIQYGVEAHGQAFDPEKPTVVVLERVGPKPVPWELYRAAQQGNGWMLGTREYDPNNPSDVELLKLMNRPLKAIRSMTEDRDFGDANRKVSSPSFDLLPTNTE